MNFILEIFKTPVATPRRAIIMVPLCLAWPHIIIALPTLVHTYWR